MSVYSLNVRRLRHVICILLTFTMAVAPLASVMAQTNAAAMAVRRSVDGLGSPATSPEGEPVNPEYQPAQGEAAPTSTPSGGGISTRYVAPGAMAVFVLRPAQFMASPIAEMLPTEVISAAGLQHAGINPADVEELIAFVDMSNPMAPGYGLTVRFNKPFRGSALPPHVRPYAQLSDLNGKKYLQTSHPMYPSFYGPNTQTLIAAPDATLRKLVESPGPTASSPILDRVRSAPTGSDLYIAINVAGFRPMLQMQTAMAPPEAAAQMKQRLEIANLISAAELTLDVTSTNPISLILHANDEPAAQQLEMMLSQSMSQAQAMLQGDPTQQALAQYLTRIIQPQRTGSSITCFYIDGQKQAQKQFASLALVSAAAAIGIPKLQALSQGGLGMEPPVPGGAPPEGFDPAAGQPPVDPAAPAEPGPAPNEVERR